MKKNKVVAWVLAGITVTGLTVGALYAGYSHFYGKGKTASAQTATVTEDGSKRAIRTDGNNSAVLAAPTNVKELPGDQERFDSYVYSVEKLKKEYNNVIVLDARPQAEYDKGHLPNAVRATWQEWSNVSVKQDSGEWAVIDSNDKLSELFGNLGIDGTKPVVIYTDTQAGWGEEGRQLWTFRVFGLTNTYILNGGIKAWKEAGGEITKEKTNVKAVTGPKANPNPDLFASTSYLAERLGKANILDTREDEEFAGTKNYGEKTNGRIPDSKHIWFKDFYNADGTLLTPAQIRARVEALGYKTDDEVVLYCTGGIRSGFTTIALQIAGYTKARNYNGSFSAWTGTNQKIDSSVLKELDTYKN
ncbi:MAG: rhodanese-like domain-containing protein [Clostridiaceae bacterium]